MLKNEIKIGVIRLNQRNILYYILASLVIIVCIWIWGYIDLLNSSSYAFAKNYFTTNQKIIEVLGEIKSCRPGFSNFKQSYSSGVWTAKFNIVLQGNNSTGVVYLKMKSNDAGWQVEDANLEVEGLDSIKLN